MTMLIKFFVAIICGFVIYVIDYEYMSKIRQEVKEMRITDVDD